MWFLLLKEKTAYYMRMSDWSSDVCSSELAQRGWIETVRGKNGGMRLGRPPEDIVLGAVLRDTENDLDLVECFATGSRCTLSGYCGLTGIIEGALKDRKSVV